MPRSPEGVANRKAYDRARRQANYVYVPKSAKQLESTRLYNKWRYAYQFYLVWYDKEVK